MSNPLPEIIYASILLAGCVVIHAWGLAFLTRSLSRIRPRSYSGTVARTWLVIWVAWWLILFHVGSIAIWALFYWWMQCLPDLESSFYFSGVTYTTVGFGDLVLPKAWRLLAPFQGLTGILMCGLSTAFFFAVALRVVQLEDSPPSANKGEDPPSAPGRNPDGSPSS